MFDFHLEEPYSFLCAFIPALFNLILLFYILTFLPKNRVTNVFALLTLGCVLWQLNDAVLRIVNTKEAADFWDSIFCVAWIFVTPLCFHFAILYTQRLKWQYSRLYISLLYIPSFIFFTLYQMHAYEHVFENLGFWGWGNFHNKNIIDIIQIYWISMWAIATLVLMFVRTFKIGDKLLRKQSFLITAGLAIPTSVGVITQVIFPTLFHRSPVPLTSSFMTFFSIATVVALRKYKLFTVSDLINNRTLIEALPIIVISVSTEKRITYINKFGKTTLGLTKKDITTLNIDDLFLHSSKEAERDFNGAWERTIKKNSVETLESTLFASTGKIDIILSSTPIINNNMVQGVLFTARDITELKRSHELIKHKEAMLEEAQQISHVGSWEWNVSTNAILWSDELYRIYGYLPRETAPYVIYAACITVEEQELNKIVIDKACIDHKPFGFYHRIIKKDGTEAIVHIQGKVTTDEYNKPVYMNGTTQDITESIRKTDMLKKQNEELQKINTELDKFVYSVSHDLRAPLTSMLGVIGICEEDTNEITTKEHLKLLKESIFKLDHFILEILDYSKNSRVEIKKEQIDFRELLDEIIGNLQQMNNEYKVDIRACVKSSTDFFSDRNRLSIVLNNLISNAIRYSSPHTSDRFAQVEVNITHDGARISVKDNGIGIEKHLHDKIFGMFYRVSADSKGSGLGLYIANEAVKKLNGTIAVESEIEKGSVFTIYLPNN